VLGLLTSGGDSWIPYILIGPGFLVARLLLRMPADLLQAIPAIAANVLIYASLAHLVVLGLRGNDGSR
jgi:hypothetical protein